MANVDKPMLSRSAASDAGCRGAAEQGAGLVTAERVGAWNRGVAARTPAALWWIVGFKVLKAGSLVALGVALLVIRHMPPENLLARAALALHLPLGSRLVQRAMDAATSLTPQREVVFGLAAIAYAGLFATEAVGLARRAPWARWLTVVATSCLIPLEVYEVARRPTLERTLVLAINLGVLAYLVRRRDVFERPAPR